MAFFGQKRLSTDRIFVGAISLIILFLTFNYVQTFILETAIDGFLSSRPLPNAALAQDQPPIELGPIGRSGGRTAARISLDFRAFDATGYPNLLQTDVGNRGFRIELSGKTLALIVGEPRQPGRYQIIVLTSRYEVGAWHTMRLTALKGAYFGIVLDGTRVNIPNISMPFSLENVRIGIGFDDSRRFNGDIRNIEFSYGDASAIELGLYAFNIGFPWILSFLLLVLFQRWLIHYPLSSADINRPRALRAALQTVVQSRQNEIVYLAALLIISSTLYALTVRYFQRQYGDVVHSLLAGYSVTEGAGPFKSELVSFILLELCFVGTIALAWGSRCLGVWQRNFRYTNHVILFCCSALLAFALGSKVSRIMVMAACSLLSLQVLLATIRIPLPDWILAIGLATWRRSTWSLRAGSTVADEYFTRYSRLLVARPLLARSISLGVGATLCTIVALPIVQAWYPIQIPNDYLESQDFVQLHGQFGTVAVRRDKFAECLRISQKPVEERSSDPRDASDCDRYIELTEEERAHLETTIRITSGWQGEAGRTLFHHSYIFVPARHFLNFGLDRSVPYLYGYGNTLFHAALMWAHGSASLSSYFSTFPVAEIIGLVAIAVLVLQITRNVWTAVAGFGLSSIAFYSITYVPIFLAASFSPLRFLGLVLQFSSICACCRSTTPRRFFFLPFAAIASAFWNFEFALMGLVGQALLLLSPDIKLTLRERGLFLISLIICVAAFSAASRTSPDIVSTVQLAFYNVGMPFMTQYDVGLFFLNLVMVHAVLLGLALLFSGRERALRVCYIPVLAFLFTKYVFNPALPHLYLVYVFFWPMCLVYLPWRHPTATFPHHQQTIPLLGTILLAVTTVFCAILAGIAYTEEAQDFRSNLLNDFVAEKWTQLGETIRFVAPESYVRDRVASIEKHMRPDDTLLILSPYDHLLNFYVSPRTLCGHFDLVTNLATRVIADKVLECARRSPQTLIVYDRAAETACPIGYLQTGSRCELKAGMKRNLVALRDQLLPSMTKVGSDQTLDFYRPTVERSESR